MGVEPSHFISLWEKKGGKWLLHKNKRYVFPYKVLRFRSSRSWGICGVASTVAGPQTPATWTAQKALGVSCLWRWTWFAPSLCCCMVLSLTFHALSSVCWNVVNFILGPRTRLFSMLIRKFNVWIYYFFALDSFKVYLLTYVITIYWNFSLPIKYYLKKGLCDFINIKNHLFDHSWILRVDAYIEPSITVSLLCLSVMVSSRSSFAFI